MDDESRHDKAPRPSPMEVVDEKVARGVYSNQSVVRHSNWEFILDFGLMTPEKTRPELISRVTLSPQHAKSFMIALQKNVEAFEQKFGPIGVAHLPPGGEVKH